MAVVEALQHPWDGYLGKPIFQGRSNYSTYYDVPTDKQCVVPIRNIQEVKTELQQKYGGD